MQGNPRKIKELEALMTEHGYSLSAVLVKELGISMTEFAILEGFHRVSVTMAVNVHRRRIGNDIRDALARRIGITRGEIDRLFDTYATIKENRGDTPRSKE